MKPNFVASRRISIDTEDTTITTTNTVATLKSTMIDNDGKDSLRIPPTDQTPMPTPAPTPTQAPTSTSASTQQKIDLTCPSPCSPCPQDEKKDEHSDSVDGDVDVDVDVGVVLRPQRRSVTFGTVGFRLYERTAGDHPSVSSGPALTFNWDYRTIPEIPLDEYEAHHPGRRTTRTQLVIPCSTRTYMLMRECGLSRSLIATFVRESNTVKKQRRQTVQNLKYEKVEEKLQSFCKIVGRVLNLRKSNEAQVKKMWEDAAKHLESSLNSTSSLSVSDNISKNLSSSPFPSPPQEEEQAQQQRQHKSNIKKFSPKKRLGVVRKKSLSFFRGEKDDTLDQPAVRRKNSLSFSRGGKEDTLDQPRHKHSFDLDQPRHEHSFDLDQPRHKHSFDLDQPRHKHYFDLGTENGVMNDRCSSSISDGESGDFQISDDDPIQISHVRVDEDVHNVNADGQEIDIDSGLYKVCKGNIDGVDTDNLCTGLQHSIHVGNQEIIPTA